MSRSSISRRNYWIIAIVLVIELMVVLGCGNSPGVDIQAVPPATPLSQAPSPKAPAARSKTLTPEDLNDFFGNGLTFWDHGAFGLDQSQFITASDIPGGRMLRVTYAAGSASRRSANEDGSAYGGTQFYMRLDNPAETLYLQYYVLLQPGFNFVKGGKLPGLFGGTVTSGQHIPDGTNGFSTRYMWRRGGAGEVYAYLPTSQDHGTSLGRGSWSFTAGQWTAIEQQIHLNTPGHNDGSLTVWINGQQVFSQGHLIYRTTNQLAIDGLFFSTFFGGGDPSWASPTNQHADFAAFTFSDHYISFVAH